MWRSSCRWRFIGGTPGPEVPESTVASWQSRVLKLLVRWYRSSSERRPFCLSQARAWVEKLPRYLGIPPDVDVTRNEAGGIPMLCVSPCRPLEDAVVLHFHGGGYILGSAAMALPLTARIAVATQMRVMSVDYRLAPEHPFPAAVEDAVCAYRSLREAGLSTSRIFLLGESAGGGLALACLLSLRDRGETLPGTAVLLSPWLDLEVGAGSSGERAKTDPMLTPAMLGLWASLYMGNLDRRAPLASPLHADPSGLPPMLIQVGTDDILLGDSVRFAEVARKAGVSIDLELWPGMMHLWHFAARWLPEGQQAIRCIGTFLRRHLA